jgi:hypothetical protein
MISAPEQPVLMLTSQVHAAGAERSADARPIADPQPVIAGRAPVLAAAGAGGGSDYGQCCCSWLAVMRLLAVGSIRGRFEQERHDGVAGVLAEVRGVPVRFEGVLAGVGLVEDEPAGIVDASAGLGRQASRFGAAGGGVPG